MDKKSVLSDEAMAHALCSVDKDDASKHTMENIKPKNHEST